MNIGCRAFEILYFKVCLCIATNHSLNVLISLPRFASNDCFAISLKTVVNPSQHCTMYRMIYDCHLQMYTTGIGHTMIILRKYFIFR